MKDIYRIDPDNDQDYDGEEETYDDIMDQRVWEASTYEW